MRGILYVSREHAPLITPEDRLSSEAAELLGALLEEPAMASTLKSRLAALPRPEIAILMDRVLERARREEEWGVPEILEACLVIIVADPSQGSRMAAFLVERPPAQIKASIVPRIGEEPWAKPVLQQWAETTGISSVVKKAIKAQR
jgi:predicted KAP-like P-loop ATPase